MFLGVDIDAREPQEGIFMPACYSATGEGFHLVVATGDGRGFRERGGEGGRDLDAQGRYLGDSRKYPAFSMLTAPHSTDNVG